jgi:valyl-tRNA synthetase
MGEPTLSKVYDPGPVEGARYAYWMDLGVFGAEPENGKTPYCIAMPPPNVTGMLTIGHVLNNTIQDALIRWRRMQGMASLWVPGCDHAGIATQNVVERALAAKGTSKEEMGREAFVGEVWKWKERHEGIIVEQLQKLGCSCDWNRQRFTLDDGLSRAVREAFSRLYQKDLIYRGKYLVNWCPRCRTALSDDEVEHKDRESKLYYIAYPIKGESGSVIIATTRPETMLGDTAVAVSPADERNAGLAGKTVILPLVGRELPVIADEYVDPEFGTGVLKVTPAHDPNDYQLGLKHGLDTVMAIGPDGRMTEETGPYAGLSREECRRRVIEELERGGYLKKTEPYSHAVGTCYRCDTDIEPYLSDQWFVRMKPLAEKALAAAAAGSPRFHPPRWEKVYLHWLENIRDWCISRQLWWGHRIPVWYCDSGHLVVSAVDPERCGECGSTKLTQDENVLDTWFSSWLWPLSILGWPDSTRDLGFFYPTSVLVTGPDIIFFWVARMVMAGLEFDGRVPFADVHLTGMIRDEKGRKMSKSLGNSPDPIEVMKRYGADALRFSVMALTPHGNDLLYSDKKVEMGRNFANKIWNATRLVLSNVEDLKAGASGPEAAVRTPSLADRWIRSRYNRAVGDVTDSLSQFRFSDAGQRVYDFLWHEYCDWYVEMAKISFYGEDAAARECAQVTALEIIKGSLKLLHPIMPFITEEIWSHLPSCSGSIARADWPVPDPSAVDPAAEREMALLMDAVGGIRNIRSEMRVPPSAKVKVRVRAAAPASDILSGGVDYIKSLARAEDVEIAERMERPRPSAYAVIEGAEIFVPLAGLIDLDVERDRLTKELGKVSADLEGANAKLASENFVKKAKPEAVALVRERVALLGEKKAKLERSLVALEG